MKQFGAPNGLARLMAAIAPDDKVGVQVRSNEVMESAADQGQRL
jgi:hypothetical protein